MKTIHQTQPLTIVGLELRTSNDEAFTTIPAHWQRFAREAVLQGIPNKTSADVYAVYTHFEHEGVDNRGHYSLIVGAPVAGLAEVPPGLVSTVVPPSTRAVLAVETGRRDLVGEAWRRIWESQDLKKTFIAEYEHYKPNGEIDICVGIAE
ncbi:GyrI-like domain-containing protein [Aquabacterium sp. A7-Y]|uniref:GyrI-like domain-containing protein n=1 Tax=Aquabacterium sp. A7-Y TaxID=1349605 RepID=UPI00223CA21E|nr:effector binding domain-containing protein [Aquabacterium sp. A7-Y]MCW7538238.1 GyrI-like domain-containing protein [Aquabacterium sp. A7-Y]